MKLKRAINHLFRSPLGIKRTFPSAVLEQIEEAVRKSETQHSGQVMVAIEPALDLNCIVRGVSPRARALEAFSRLGVWDTKHNNGVLIYLLLADRDVEIVADRGIHLAAGQEAWDAICKEMEEHFRRGEFSSGVIRGIEKITCLLKDKFPPESGSRNELPNRPVIL